MICVERKKRQLACQAGTAALFGHSPGIDAPKKSGPIAGATIQRGEGKEGNVREGDARRRSSAANGRTEVVENCGRE
jgi:hypothetical protein